MADAAIHGEAFCDVVRVWPRADHAAFAEGLSRLATATAVVACQGAGGPGGLLVTSLATVSANPPRLLFSIDKAAPAHAALIAAQSVSIALLDADQGDVAEAFGPGGQPRFDDGRWRLDPASPPALTDALAAFAGPIRCRIDGGAATIFIVDVSTAVSRDSQPLVRFAGRGRTLG